jgi:Icc-related predicted phosphoesterase
VKILCVSDQIDPLVYSSSIKVRFSDINLVLCAGDLPLDYLDFIVSSLNIPLFFVFGNHHTEDMKFFKMIWRNFTAEEQRNLMEENQRIYSGCGAVHLGSKVKTEENFIIAGLGGSMRYNNGSNQFTEFQMLLEIIRIIPQLLWNRVFHGRYCDILLTHAPPKGIHDKKDKCHTGFKIFLWFMKTFKPSYLVHGHIHLYDLSDVRRTKWKDTTVINAYSHCVIDLGD